MCVLTFKAKVVWERTFVERIYFHVGWTQPSRVQKYEKMVTKMRKVPSTPSPYRCLCKRKRMMTLSFQQHARVFQSRITFRPRHIKCAAPNDGWRCRRLLWWMSAVFVCGFPPRRRPSVSARRTCRSCTRPSLNSCCSSWSSPASLRSTAEWKPNTWPMPNTTR